ncbi:MAG: hypothetical protein JXR49_04305 [Acidobacteria bacterium]|nr:hypothetical protein [Acidobacteriota bacterium]
MLLQSLSHRLFLKGANPLLNAGEVAFFGCRRHESANGIQVDIYHAGGNGGIIEQNLALEAGFPESSIFSSAGVQLFSGFHRRVCDVAI